MRYIMLVIAVIASVALATAQDKILRRGQTYALYTGTASDTINGVATTDAVFMIPDRDYYTISYHLDIDTLTGGGDESVTIQPQGSYDGTTYTNIGSSVTFAGSADTAFSVNVHDTYSVTETYSSYTAGVADDDSIFYSDTITYSSVTNTRIVNLPGVDYRYIKILLTGGGASSRCELQLAGIKISDIVIGP